MVAEEEQHSKPSAPGRKGHRAYGTVSPSLPGEDEARGGVLVIFIRGWGNHCLQWHLAGHLRLRGQF